MFIYCAGTGDYHKYFPLITTRVKKEKRLSYYRGYVVTTGRAYLKTLHYDLSISGLQEPGAQDSLERYRPYVSGLVSAIPAALAPHCST